VAAEGDVGVEDLGGLAGGGSRDGHLDDRWMSLSTGPGWRVLALMPREATSFATVRMRPTRTCMAVA
jgi:hypothetical protein